MRYVMQGWLIALLGVMWLSVPRLAIGGDATAFIKQSTDATLRVLEDPRLQGPEKRSERKERLREISNEVFDWQEIARRALATHWRERTPQQQQEFVQLFKDLVQRSYTNRLEDAVQQKQDIRYLDEQGDDSRAVVKVKVVTKRNQEVPFEYRLHKSNGAWKIYDVAIEGVSLINNYRSQFNRIITSSSYEELVQKMKTKGEEAFPGPQQKRQ